MAYRDRLADDMRGFWGEKGLRASHEERIEGSQVEMMEEGKIGGGERLQGLLQVQGREKGKVSMGADTRLSASRPVCPTLSLYGHITALLGAGLPRTSVWLCRSSHSWAPHTVVHNTRDVYQIENRNTSEKDSSAWNVLDHQM
jgi:hypothetical protein